MVSAYEQLKLGFSSELNNISDYRVNNILGQEHGGFVGKIDHNNKIVPKIDFIVVF